MPRQGPLQHPRCCRVADSRWRGGDDPGCRSCSQNNLRPDGCRQPPCQVLRPAPKIQPRRGPEASAAEQRVVAINGAVEPPAPDSASSMSQPIVGGHCDLPTGDQVPAMLNATVSGRRSDQQSDLQPAVGGTHEGRRRRALWVTSASAEVPNPSSDGGVGRSRICAARRGRRHAVPRPRSGLGASTNTTARAVGTSRMVPLDHPFLNSFAKRSSHGRPANSTSIHSDGNCCWRAVNHYRRVQPAVGTGSWRSGSVEQVGSR